MLLLLRDISKVVSWRTSPNLSWGNCHSFGYCSPRSYYTKALYCYSSTNSGSHTNIREALKCAIVKSCVRPNIYIISDGNLITVDPLRAANVNKILNDGVFANLNLSSVTSCSDSMPEWWTFFNNDISNNGGIWCNPVSLSDKKLNSLHQEVLDTWHLKLGCTWVRVQVCPEIQDLLED